MKRAGKLLAIALALGAVSCLSFPRKFPPFENVSRIVVDGDSEIRVIDDPEEIDAVMRFVNERNGGWTVPWYGVPVPFLTADLYEGRDFMGHFGVGANFFEMHRDGGFFCHAATDDERNEFMNLLGVPEETIQALEAEYGMGSW